MASTCYSPPAAASSCGQPRLLKSALPPALGHTHYSGWRGLVMCVSLSGIVHGLARFTSPAWAPSCGVSAPAWSTLRATVSRLLPHTGASWQAVADEIRAARPDVLVEIVPCDLGRPAGVATLCAAAERRDVTLAVPGAGLLHPYRYPYPYPYPYHTPYRSVPPQSAAMSPWRCPGGAQHLVPSPKPKPKPNRCAKPYLSPNPHP